MLCRFATLALAALAAATSAGATTVTVHMTGTLTSVNDDLGILDGSIRVGGAFSFTLGYDDATPPADQNSCCAFFILPASADLGGASGSYSFSTPGEFWLLVDNDAPTRDAILVNAQSGFSMSGPLPPGVSIDTVNSTLSISLIDSSKTALDSASLEDLNWSVSAYGIARLAVDIELTGTPTFTRVLLGGTITHSEVLPEPSLLILGWAACVALSVAQARSSSR